MTQETIKLIMIAIPVSMGAVIAVLNNERVFSWIESVDSWLARKKTEANESKSRISLLVYPVLWLVEVSGRSRITHRGLKNGLRVVGWIVLIYILAFGLYLITMLVIALLLVAAVLFVGYILLKAVGDVQTEKSQGYEKGKQILDDVVRGKRVNPDTGVIQENQGVLGWKDTDQRIDPETGQVQVKDGLMGWKETGAKVEKDTGVVQKDSLFGHEDTGTRIDPKTGVIQKKGVLGWEDTDRRINPDTGKPQQQKGVLGWTDE